MRNVKNVLIFIIACVLCVNSCFIFVSAESAGALGVTEAEGYPSDIVAVDISIDKLPSNGFAAGKFVVKFGENLEYVNTVQCDENYGDLLFGKPSEASAGKNEFTIVCLSGVSSKNYDYTRKMVTVYFRIKSGALPTDDASKNLVAIEALEVFNKSTEACEFASGQAYVTVLGRDSALGETLKGHSLTLDGATSLNFHVSIPELLINDNSFVEFSVNGAEDTVVTKALSECRYDDFGNVILSCEFPAPMWSRTVSARICDGDGTYGETYSYSVKNYAMYMLTGHFSTGDDDADVLLKDLCVALLNYGGFAQQYFEYFADSSDELANGNVLYGENELIVDIITGEYDDRILADTSASFSGNCNGIAYYGVNVAVDSATAITHYFTVDGNADDYVFTLTSPVSDDIVLVPFDADGKIAVVVTNIPAAYLDVPYTVTVCAKSGEGEQISVTYSVRSYMAHNLRSTVSGLPDLIRAMYLYSVAADNYFGR